MENSGQVSETTDDGITSDNNGSVSSYENLPAGVPYTSGFTTTSGVASIVAPGGGDEESRVLYDNGDGTYSDYYGSRYSYQGDGNWQMPMEIHIVPGMMKTIISEHSWKNMNSRAAVAPLM